ncbi:MAG: hypothetical protein JWQ90_6 [Hydrocarboniphaga sp.]|uniref:hypothetical protein n=1 Tax=Hydrocarboniphaga sp. TaxID=2033016 RepID=UPI0026354C4E|nr:hypothetical protein [Hydrocarboniphaga sp.]MDB5967556.1 hypothetical protein [Hydrocarboniphaga sp.]
MPQYRSQQSLSLTVLSISLILALVLFGVRAKYSPGVYYALAIAQLSVVCLAAWKLGAGRFRSEERVNFALAGGLLIAPVALLSLLPGVGPPGDQVPAENQLRFLVLLVDAILVAVGMGVLKEALVQHGERVFSTLAFTSITLASPLYILFTGIQYSDYVAQDRGWSWAASVDGSLHELSPLDTLSVTLLFFGGVLTYLATAAFAMSLRQTQWLGRKVAHAFVIASLFAVTCLVIRGLDYPGLAAAFGHWYTIPGFVVGIPAVPWIMPCMLGVLLLRRAGR